MRLRRILRIALVGLVSVLLIGSLGVAALAVSGADVGRLLRGAAAESDAPSPDPTPASATADPSSSPSAATAPTPSSTPTPTQAPAMAIQAGDRGLPVRELQHRLFQIDWLPETTTGRMDAATVAAVRGFQAKRGLPVTGVVDDRTWQRLGSMTQEPTHDELFNVWHPGPVLIGAGAGGDDVRAVQARLKQISWLFGDVSGSYDAATVAAVKGFQDKRGIPVTGSIDQRTMDRLIAMTSTPTHEAMYNIVPQLGALDARCLTGRVLCIDKSSRTLRWVIDGHVQQTLEARFGSTLNDTPTREGVFSVYLMDADHVSKLYGSSMPYAMFFSGGQAVHYSSDFAATGYTGASHGCVNIRDYGGIQWLFSQVRVGDRVVVYWS